MQDQLMLCPFCASVPEVMYDEMSDWGGAWVRCTNCDVEQLGYFSEDEAVKKWNTRAKKN